MRTPTAHKTPISVPWMIVSLLLGTVAGQCAAEVYVYTTLLEPQGQPHSQPRQPEAAPQPK